MPGTPRRPTTGRHPGRHPSPRRGALLVALLLVLPLAACSSTGASGGSSESAGSGEETLTLLAASSLTEVYGTLGSAFEEQHPGVTVTSSFGSSTDLAEQAADGAPGDVLSTADPTAMGVAQDAGVVGDTATFATNTLVLVVPPDDPADITSLDDLDGTTWVRCADEVPCGRVALAVLADQQVTAEPASLEEDVKSALEKVTSGEADAALVYASDARSAGSSVRTITIPGAQREATSYLLGALDQASDPTLAQQWVDLVLSEQGQQVLADAGFGPP